MLLRLGWTIVIRTLGSSVVVRMVAVGQIGIEMAVEDIRGSAFVVACSLVATVACCCWDCMVRCLGG